MAYSVRISGTVLSSLLFECANSYTDIEGLFLGSLSSRKTLASDDTSKHAIEKREDFLVIHGYQILKEKPYDERGNMLRHVLMGQQKDVSSLVGYFKFRRQSDVSLSERDQLWMNSYANNVPHGCIAIISSNLNSFADKSTHTYEFAFWDMKNKVNKLPLDITNMTESTLGYKHFMSNAPYKLPQSSNNQLLSQLPSPSNIIIQQYDEIYQQSIKSLQASTDKVIAKETELLELKRQIQLLESTK